MSYLPIQTRVADQVAEQILELIREAGLKPGDQLPGQRTMMKELSASRAALREAIRALEARGVLEVRHGLGTFVATPGQRTDAKQLPSTLLLANRERVLDLLEVRLALEPLAAALAAGRAEQAEVAALEEVLEQMGAATRAGDVERAMNGDVRFHELISAFSGNTFLVKLNSKINVSLLEGRHAYYSMTERASASSAEHRRILASIAARDPDGAAEAMRRHIASAMRFWQELVDVTGAE